MDGITVVLLGVIVVVGVLAFFIPRRRKMSDIKYNQIRLRSILASGILQKDEEIIEHSEYSHRQNNERIERVIIFTNKRFISCKKPSGSAAKGYDLVCDCTWGEVQSITSSDTNTVNLTIKQDGKREGISFYTDNSERCIEKIVGIRNAYKEPTTVEVKTLIIEEARKERAPEILSKRLARGKITVDEFHRLIQRT